MPTARRWAESTTNKVGVDLRRHILPTLGDRPLASLRRADIETWANALSLSPGSISTTVQTLATMLSSAVEDGRIPRNPATGMRLPKAKSAPIVPMSVEEAKAICSAAPERFRAAMVLAAGTGLRQGELFAVTADRVDFLRQELRVDRQLWSPQSGPPRFEPPRYGSYRTIGLSSVVTAALSAHVAAFGLGPEGHSFTIDAGRPVSRRRGGVIMERARSTAGIEGITWHDFRHYHASVLLSAGVSPALVAERLGHSIPTLLRTYAHVIRSDEDRVRTIVDSSLGEYAEDWLRTASLTA